jgi:N-acetylglutamate synthase-like GNAT family acetyltransferase
MISEYNQSYFNDVYEIINDGAMAYKGIIPADRWKEPYMSEEELKTQIADGVTFWMYFIDEKAAGVMGIQLKKDVTLIRHAYIRTLNRNKGIGGRLLEHLRNITSTPILIGTWADASWAIQFYQKHGFRRVALAEKNRLLQKYWTIPIRQVETSVVLASADWKDVDYIT